MKSGLLPARIAALPLALAAALPAFSQTTVAPQLKEMVVTASRVATPITDVIGDVTIIDRSALDRAGQSSLRDILSQQAGVQILSNGSYRSSTGVFLRGATSSQTIVLVDGVRVGSATNGTAAFENLPLARIERIEILRGASSALYGPDAVGGVIQIFTRAPSEGLAVDASIGAGSNGLRQSSGSLRGSFGADAAVGFSLGASREKATGISTIIAPASTNYNPDNDGFVSNSFDAKLVAELNRKHTVTASLLRSDTEYQFDGRPSPNPLNLTKFTSDARSKARLGNATLKWDAQFLPIWKSALTFGTSDDKSVTDYYRISNGQFGGGAIFNTARQQTTWQNDLTLGKDVLSLTVENRTETVDSSTVFTVNKRSVNSLLGSYALNRTDWNALAVLRRDTNSQFGGFNNWSLGGGYRLTPALRAVASAGTSFQAPTFNQLYFPNFGIPTQTPQKNRAVEAGLKYQEGSMSFGAVVYRNNIQGFIIPSTNVQILQGVLRGVTLSADLQDANTNYALSYDYADPRSVTAVAATNDLRLVRVAQNVLNARVSHRMGSVSLYSELKMSGNREDTKVVGAGRDVLGGYSLLNAGLTWSIDKNVALSLRVNNIANKQYMLANGFSTLGRNALVSMSWAM